MTSFLVEFTIEDYIIDEWLESHGYVDQDFEDFALDFIDEYFGTTPDNVTIL